MSRVRTPITIDRDLLRRAKVVAAQTDRTLSDLVEEGLAGVVDRPEPERPRPRLLVFRSSGGLAPGITEEDFMNTWELIDRLDREDAAGGRVLS